MTSSDSCDHSARSIPRKTLLATCSVHAKNSSTLFNGICHTQIFPRIYLDCNKLVHFLTPRTTTRLITRLYDIMSQMLALLGMKGYMTAQQKFANGIPFRLLIKARDR